MTGKRDLQKEQTNRKILDAALKEFTLNGYSSARLSTIAKEADVTNGLITQRWGGKDKLYMELLSSALGFIADISKEERNLNTMISRIIGELRKMVLCEDEKILFLDTALGGHDTPEYCLQRIKGVFETTSLYAELEKKGGGLISEDKSSFEIFYLFFRMTLGMMLWHKKTGKQMPPDEFFMRYFLVDDYPGGEIGLQNKIRKCESIIENFSSDFINIMRVDCSSGEMEVISANTADASWVRETASHGMEEYVKRFAERYIRKEDYDYFLSAFDVNSILQRLRPGKPVFVDYIISRNGKSLFYETKIVLDSMSAGLPVVLVGTHNVDDYARLKIRSCEQDSVIETLLSDYFFIDYVNFDTGDCTTYLQGKEGTGYLNYKHGNYYERMEKLISGIIYEEDKESFISANKKEKIIRELEQHSSYSYNFRVFYNGRVRYHQIRYIRAGEESSSVIVAFRDIDGEIRRDRETRRLEKTAEQNATLSVLAAEYDFVIGYKKDTCEIDVFRSEGIFRSFFSVGQKNVSGKDIDVMFEALTSPAEFILFREAVRKEHENVFKKKGYACVEFSVKKNNKIVWYRAVYSIGENDENMLILGIRPSDSKKN